MTQEEDAAPGPSSPQGTGAHSAARGGGPLTLDPVKREPLHAAPRRSTPLHAASRRPALAPGLHRHTQRVLPSELLPRDEGVVVGERVAADGGLDVGQQAAGAAARRPGRALLPAGPAPRVPGPRTFGDHGPRGSYLVS
ncbi:hypothetical protein EYF80_057838 [Liparis tanakae]|uniref:Uncharacterized protein n=1 Tax=Liparis tanakae TaxID=230148 RepID=A0A4Z2EUE7_9TELE|nr:hypothetical protein EYF80_057838 [Liparis tanakae]